MGNSCYNCLEIGQEKEIEYIEQEEDQNQEEQNRKFFQKTITEEEREKLIGKQSDKKKQTYFTGNENQVKVTVY